MRVKGRRGLLGFAALAVLGFLGWWLLRPADPVGGARKTLAVEEVGPGPASLPAPAVPPAPAPVLDPAPPEAEEEPAENPPAPSGFLLLARDAGSRAPLPGARIWLCAFRSHGAHGPLRTWEADPGLHPSCTGKEPMAVTGADGRVRVDIESDRFLHVLAPGHSWGKVSRAEDGSLVADLPAGGAVRLTVRRWGELEEPRVFAYGAEMGPDEVPGRPVSVSTVETEEAGGEAEGTAEVVLDAATPFREVTGPRTGEEVLVEGLEPGTWTFFVERGAQGGEVYARGATAVVAGAEAALLLDAVPTTAGPRGPVKVTVIGSPGKWGWNDFDVEVAQGAFIADPDPFVVLRGLDERNAHLEGRADWDATLEAGEDRRTTTLSPDLPPGRYRATVNPPGWSTEVVVPEGTHEVTLRVPAPAETEVAVTDALTGRPLASRVTWVPFPGETKWAAVEGDAETGLLLLRAPPGSYRLHLSAPGHREIERSVDLVAGPRGRVAFALEPAASVRVLLRVDGAPFEGFAYAHAEMKFTPEESKRLFEDPEAQESGIVTGQSGPFVKGEVTFENLTPGSCEIKVGPLAGFAPVKPRTVQVHAGRVTEVVVDLARE